jgi:multiple sugar transport system permease protein
MKKVPTIILYVFLFAASILWIYPYVWMLLSSFKPTNEIYSGFLPSQFTLDNYRFILEAADKMERPFIQALGNSIFISVTVTLGVLVSSALVGFALSRLNFKGKNAIFNFIIFQMIFPGFLFIVPLYVLIKNLGLIDTRTALILPSLVSAWGVFMFTQSFRAVPNEYLEAARME